MKISEEVLKVLSEAETVENSLVLVGQINRKLYVETNKVLESAGGKWNRKAKAHIFESDARDIIDTILVNGEITTNQEIGYFPTPKKIVEEMIIEAAINPGMLVLEPSAGKGAIANEIAKITEVDCVELMADNAAHLNGVKSIKIGDFLEIEPEKKYDRVLMNPPFAKQQDIRHVLHAHKFLKDTGVLVSIMGAGVTFRNDKLAKEFRVFVNDKNGDIVKLPEGAFKESGTMVNTVIVTIPA